MDTHFASAERSSGDELAHEITTCSKNPVIDSLLKTVGGLLAVLNEHRQILAVNSDLLEMLGIRDPEKVLGLRPGEAVNCIHAFDMPGGCGTSKHCDSCEAAIAIVATLGQTKPEERFCAVTVKKNGRAEDIFLRVRSCPFALEGRRLVLLFLQDWTAQQQRCALERTFFHDFSNIVGGLEVAVDLLTDGSRPDRDELISNIKAFSKRLSTELKIQRSIYKEDSYEYRPEMDELSAEQVVREINNIFLHHPAAKGKKLRLPEPIPPLTFKTDVSILLRILVNMLVNAFEATDPGAEVKFWIEKKQDTLVFCVWNKEAIPEKVMLRLFQRNFSTKGKSGRGLGTFSMKLLGERFLGGKVACTTSEAKGTVFRFSLPQARAEKQAPPEALTAGGKHILLVDDDEMLLKVMQKILGALGHTVTAFSSSPEALAAFQRAPDRFDLVISDQTMPRMKGFDLAARMMELRADLPVILYTGYSEAITPEDVMASGIKALAYKPVTKKDLARLIHRVLP